MYCSNCGAKIADGSKFCSECGALTGVENKNPDPIRMSRQSMTGRSGSMPSGGAYPGGKGSMPSGGAYPGGTRAPSPAPRQPAVR